MNAKEEHNSPIIERAKAAILARDYEQAIRIYRGLLKSEPGNIGYLGTLGDLFVKSSDDKTAMEYYKEIIRLEPQNVDALNSLGGIYRRLKMYDESISVLERAVMFDETNVQVYYNLGFTYKLMGNYDDAIQCFKTVVEENPRDVLAYNHIGSIYAEQEKYGDAVASYLHGLKADPNHPVLHLNLAKSYGMLGEFTKAQDEYEAALKSKPGWLEAIENYSDLLLKKNRTKTACDIVKKALNLNPKDPAMHTKLGDVYCHQDNYENAEAEYNTALSIHPEFKNAMSGLATTYELTGRLDEAIEVAERLETISPDDANVKRQHAHILLSADKIEKAGEKIQELYNENPDDVHTLNLLGQYYICAGDEKKAAGCFKKIKTLKPDYTNFYRDAGNRHNQKGDYKKAEEFYQKFIDQNPEDTEGIKAIAKNYEAQGMLVQALASYNQIEAFDSANVGFRAGRDRINSKILEEREKKQEKKTSIDADEFFDSDDDISIGDRVRVAEEVTLSFEDMDNPEPQIEKETIPDDMENRIHNYNAGFENLQKEEITDSEIFSEGRLDSEISAYNQDHYSKGLDDLIGDVDLDDEGSGLEEDNTSMEDFFANNPFSNGVNKSSAPQEHDFVPEYEFEPEEKPKKKEQPKKDVVALDDGWQDDEEMEKKEDHKPAKADGEPEVEQIPPQDKIEEPAEEPDFENDESVFEDEPAAEVQYKEDAVEFEDEDEEIPEEITEEPEVVPEVPDEDAVFEDESILPDDGFEEGDENFFIPQPEIDEEDDCSEPELMDSENSDLFEKASDAIQNVTDAIKENEVPKTTSVTADLFEKLRAMSKYLPEEKRKEFLESKIRLQLDYIISKLSGNAGLLATAKELRKQLGQESIKPETETGMVLLEKVLNYSKELIRGLPDKNMVASLTEQIELLMSKL